MNVEKGKNLPERRPSRIESAKGGFIIRDFRREWKATIYGGEHPAEVNLKKINEGVARLGELLDSRLEEMRTAAEKFRDTIPSTA